MELVLPSGGELDLEMIRTLAEGYGGYIYGLMFAWAFLEGETFVLIAAFAASLGYLNAATIFCVAWIGSFAGDQLYYWLGRRYGNRILRRMPRLEPPTRAALALLKQRDVVFILGFRFMYGVRNVASLAIALSGVAPSRFAMLNFIAAGLWAACFVGAGYGLGMLFGSSVEAMLLGGIKVFGLSFLGAMLVILTASFFVMQIRARAKKRAA